MAENVFEALLLINSNLERIALALESRISSAAAEPVKPDPEPDQPRKGFFCYKCDSPLVFFNDNDHLGSVCSNKDCRISKLPNRHCGIHRGHSMEDDGTCSICNFGVNQHELSRLSYRY